MEIDILFFFEPSVLEVLIVLNFSEPLPAPRVTADFVTDRMRRDPFRIPAADASASTLLS